MCSIYYELILIRLQCHLEVEWRHNWQWGRQTQHADMFVFSTTTKKPKTMSFFQNLFLSRFLHWFLHNLEHFSAVEPPNLLSWITNQLLPISSQVTGYLFNMISESTVKNGHKLQCPLSFVTKEFRPARGSNQRSDPLPIRLSWQIPQNLKGVAYQWAYSNAFLLVSKQ
jgi:hypothetical protein